MAGVWPWPVSSKRTSMTHRLEAWHRARRLATLILATAVTCSAIACQQPPGLLITPATAVPSPAPPLGVATAAPAATPTVRYAVFRGSGQDPQGPWFELQFAEDGWRREGTLLINRHLPGCTLELSAVGRQVTGPRQEGEVRLGVNRWATFTFPTEQLMTYWLETPNSGYYLFEVDFPDPADACRAASEQVITTFQLIEPSP